MWKLALLLWIVLGTTVAGIFFLVVLATPALAASTAKFGVAAIALGFAVAVPLAFYVARQIAPKGV